MSALDGRDPSTGRAMTPAEAARLWDELAPREATDPGAARALQALRRSLLEEDRGLLGDLLSEHPQSAAARCLAPVVAEDPTGRLTADASWWERVDPVDIVFLWEAKAPYEASDPAAALALHDLRQGLLGEHADLLVEILAEYPTSLVARCLGPSLQGAGDRSGGPAATAEQVAGTLESLAVRSATDPGAAWAHHQLQVRLVEDHPDMLRDLRRDHPASLRGSWPGQIPVQSPARPTQDPAWWQSVTAPQVAELWEATAPYEASDPAATRALHDLRQGLLERRPDLLRSLVASFPQSLAARCVGPLADVAPTHAPQVAGQLGLFRPAPEVAHTAHARASHPDPGPSISGSPAGSERARAAGPVPATGSDATALGRLVASDFPRHVPGMAPTSAPPGTGPGNAASPVAYGSAARAPWAVLRDGTGTPELGR